MLFRSEVVADIRAVPRSRRNPQFDRTELKRSLAQQHTRYVHLPALGGLRRACKDSINTGWQNASFRGYADYMQTPEFQSAIDDLIALAAGQRTVIMCAEAVPWRCHRSLVGDALIVRGVAVEELMSETKSKPHKLTCPSPKIRRATRIESSNVRSTTYVPSVQTLRTPRATLK